MAQGVNTLLPWHIYPAVVSMLKNTTDTPDPVGTIQEAADPNADVSATTDVDTKINVPASTGIF